MNRLLMAAAVFCIGSAGAAYAQYNPAPAGDAQYAQCLASSLNRYTGGTSPSRVAGQSKVEAYCQCMWNETPDDFRGDLLKFGETAKGAATNKTCEAHSGWQ